MGECTWENEMILLFDSYDEESRLWHESIKRAGYDHMAIVIQEDDFLPDGVFSAYDLILGNCHDKMRRERYFNEIAVPDSWDIHVGNDESGSVFFQREEKGKIYYVEAEKKRLVKAVDWYDRKGVVRFRDHYNRYGDLCARTVYDNQGKPMSKTWLSHQGQEIIVENLVSGDIILNDEGQEVLFQKKRDVIIYYFIKFGFAEKRILFNSLSTPLFILNGLPGTEEKRDMLIWQGAIGDEIPGNMQWILNGGSGRIGKIIVQRADTYDKLIQLGAKKEMLYKLGFLYPFKKENRHKPEALICTPFDKIEHGRELVEALPEMHFHIAAPTAMSPLLTDLGKYRNVSLYPAVAADILEKLYQDCDYYFDINYYWEFASADYRAFLHNHLILAFEETVHERSYVAGEHIYPITEFEVMKADIRTIMSDDAVMEWHLDRQHKQAMAEDEERYRKILKGHNAAIPIS